MLRAGQVIHLLVIATLALAVIAVHSADMRVGGSRFELMSILTSRHVTYAGIAMVVMLLASRLNLREAMKVRWWLNPVVLLLAGSLALVALAMVPGVGVQYNGARRWLRIPGLGDINFQPSELTKWAIVLVLAWWCAKRHDVMHRFGKGVLPALIIVAVASALVVLEDMGTAALIGVMAIMLLIAGGARIWQISLLVPPAVALAIGAVLMKPHRVERLTTFLRPWDDMQGAGYQMVQSFVAFGEGGLLGAGLGNGIQKMGNLPTNSSDFLFAVIANELGLVGVSLVVGLFLAMLWTGLSILKQCPDKFGRLVVLGIIATLVLQALINMAVVTGLVPTKGIALPLLSAGGTGWIVTAFALGLVSSIDTANHIEAQGAEPEPQELPPALLSVSATQFE
ncbi:MAG: FtsW/RodA/SpoVE family cell cycle protein [Phycisphaeraceae bacterium]